MSPKTFNEMCPYVDSVYTKLQQELLQAHGTAHAFRNMSADFGKAKKSSPTQDADGKLIKCRRHSSIRDAHLCNIRINVSRPVDGTVVITERLARIPTHTHDIEAKPKQPKIIPQPKYTMQSEVQVHTKVRRAWWIIVKKVRILLFRMY